MSDIVYKMVGLSIKIEKNITKAPSREEAEEAVRTLIRWAGDNPDREGLRDTPKRVIKSYQEFFNGYKVALDKEWCRSFENHYQYDDIIILKDIRLESFCEHHMAPIIGKVAIGYIPKNKIIGLSKLGRIVDMYGKRLQLQEKLTVQIAEAVSEMIDPQGVIVEIKAAHNCLSTRGAHKVGSEMRTCHAIGIFKENAQIKREFLSSI